MFSTITSVPARSPSPPSTHSELNGAIACVTPTGHCWPCCGEARIAACRHTLRFGRGGAAEGNNHLSAKHLETERKKIIFCLSACICLAREKKGEGRRHLARWSSVGSSKTSAVTCHWQHNETICVSWRRAPNQGSASSHGNLLQSSCKGRACWVMQEELNTTSPMSIPWGGVCWEPYGQLVSPPVPCRCHLPCKSTAWLHLCLFPLSLSAAFGMQEATCCCHGGPRCHGFMTVGESQICTAALHNQRLGFHVYGI